MLAAGAARRFGRAKQLERWPDPNSPTLVERATWLAAECGAVQVLVVTGNRAEEVAALFSPPNILSYPVTITTVHNPRWQEGQGFSVATAVKALPPACEAALFFLADQPRLKLASAQALVQAFEQSQTGREKLILFPTYQGRRGNPVLFGRHYFPLLAALEGDTGGRTIIKAYPEAVQEIALDDPTILEDVDTPEDLAALK